MKLFLQVLEKWGDAIVAFMPRLLLAIIVGIVFYFLAKALKKSSLRFYSKVFKKQKGTAELISKLIYWTCIIVGFLIILEVIGLASVLTKMLAGAGVVGIVAGFAFKEIASNFISGLFINAQRPFEKGDLVEIDGNFGNILEVGIISTRIKTMTGQAVYIPNYLVFQSGFTNYSAFNKRRVVLASGVSYGDDLEHVKKVALDEVRKIDSLLQDETVDFYFTGIGSSSYNFELRFWIKFKNQPDYLKAMSEAIMRIKRRFEEEDVSLAYEVMTLDFGVKGGVNLFDHPIEVRGDLAKER